MKPSDEVPGPVTPAALRYIANDFACNADHPLHRERLKEVVIGALRQAADELEGKPSKHEWTEAGQ